MGGVEFLKFEQQAGRVGNTCLVIDEQGLDQY